MRVELELLRSVDGALVGTAVWAEGSANVRFHGTLELVRVLHRAAGVDADDGAEMASTPQAGDHDFPASPDTVVDTGHH
jgi:hypothetical protein